MSSIATAVPSAQTAPAQRVIQILNGLWASRAVHVAASLGLADALADGAKTTQQLAEAVGAEPRSLYRLLRALASLGIFREDAPGRFTSTEMGDTLRSGVDGSLHAVAVSVFGGEEYQAWDALEHSVRTGATAFDHRYQMDVWEFFRRNPDRGKLFDQAMTDFTRTVDPALIKAYDFNGFKHIVDVGGGHGALLSAILSSAPATRGTVFDQPYVAEGATKALAASGLIARADAVGGDFFESVPAGGDLYVMKFIIHDWDDARSVRILANIRKGIQPDGKLLLVETVVPEGNGEDFSKLMDLNMLVMTGGCERTEKQFAELLRQAGFRLARVVPTESVVNIIEAVPAA